MNDGPTGWQLLGVAALHLLVIVVFCALLTFDQPREFLQHLFSSG